jgi:hypothetical protein
MQTDEPDHLPIEIPLLRHVIREAALGILSRHGYELSAESTERARRAISCGFVVTHRIAEPGTIRRRQGYWHTRTIWNQTSALQQTIEVQAGEDLIVLGWRGDGQIVHDRLHRGPWEYHLVHHAHMSPATRRMARLPHIMPLGTVGLSWPAGRITAVRSGRLRNDVIFDVHGTRGCVRDIAPAGSTMSDLIERIRLTDAMHLWPSRCEGIERPDQTSFTLRARSNFSAPGPHRAKRNKTIRYWVEAGGTKSAAQLLLRLDRDANPNIL